MNSPLLYRGEVLLASGLSFLVLTISLTHFVMGVFLAIIPAIIALCLLLGGMARGKGESGSVGRQFVGALLLLVGLAVLLPVAFKSCALSYQLALHNYRASSPAPAPRQWLGIFPMSFLPVLFVYPGISLWTNWSPRRRVFWCGAAIAVTPGVVLVHQVLASLGFAITA